ncbi:MAG: peptide MFS transporter [Bacteroidales bacterium]|nr:peptide MFS transporter [Bacteroidales bacterium]
MFKGHPKGLYALALANTGERFGYYTMLAIFVLFLQAKFGLTARAAGQFYGIFLAAVYFMPILGGFIADKFWGYGKTVVTGILVMFAGYLLLFAQKEAGGSMAFTMMIIALLCIAVGTGLFKGNLQVMVGNLYDDAKYAAKRDGGFSLFYMAINIGSMFAPTTATAVTNLFLGKSGFSYDANIPSLAHQFLDGTITSDGMTRLEALASAQSSFSGDMTAFCTNYINSLSEAYSYGFGIACISLILSIAIYFGFRRLFKHVDVRKGEQKHEESVVELTPKQTKDRIVALCLVFAVVIFFWMAFQQAGLTLTYFARDYTSSVATGWTRIGFDVFTLAMIAVGVYALFGVFQSDTKKGKTLSGLLLAACAAGVWYKAANVGEQVNLLPQIFQHFNPFFVVALTPVSMALFGALAKKGKEPSAPRKIALGMLVAALGYCVMAAASMGLPSPKELSETGGVSSVLVSPNWLISTYLVLTFGELLLSPMGISFVSKVAPPKLKGLMMGLWFGATAIGNYLTSVISSIWNTGLSLVMIWGVLIILCVISAVFMFSMMKKLESATE